MLEALPLLGSIASGVMGMFGAQKQNETAAAMAAQNIALQREFAQNAIQWKVRDAAKAGVHPLYALGASTHSFSPVSVGAVNEMAPFANMGQDLARAASAMKGPTERANAVSAVQTAMEVKAGQLRLENMELQNQALRAKLATINQPGSPPGVEFPVPENSKVEQRPPLMVFGSRWDTNPNTSPMKAWEDQYGDEGPIAWGMPIVIGANDAAYNISKRLRESSVARYMHEMQRAVQQYAIQRMERR